MGVVWTWTVDNQMTIVNFNFAIDDCLFLPTKRKIRRAVQLLRAVDSLAFPRQAVHVQRASVPRFEVPRPGCNERIQRLRRTHPAGKNAKHREDLGKATRRRRIPMARPRADWDAVKVERMRMVLMLKFQQNATCRAVLLSTGNASISEHTSSDLYWGDGGAAMTGGNHLGRLLVEVRGVLRGAAKRKFFGDDDDSRKQRCVNDET
jgi:ribA/ribD-fused uncharacterized protein